MESPLYLQRKSRVVDAARELVSEGILSHYRRRLFLERNAQEIRTMPPSTHDTVDISHSSAGVCAAKGTEATQNHTSAKLLHTLFQDRKGAGAQVLIRLSAFSANYRTPIWQLACSFSALTR